MKEKAIELLEKAIKIEMELNSENTIGVEKRTI